MSKTASVFVVFEETDTLYVNFFTTADAAASWTASARMGDKVLGPFDVEVEEPEPFEVVVGADQHEFIESMYLNDESRIPTADHASLLGPYTVYDSIESFERACR